MNFILDSGALVAIDRRDPEMARTLQHARLRDIHVKTSGAVVAQVWRDGSTQVNLSRTLTGIDVVPLDDASGRLVGKLLARSSTADVVDGHVALLVRNGDRLLTSDTQDLKHLLDCRKVNAAVISV